MGSPQTKGSDSTRSTVTRRPGTGTMGSGSWGPGTRSCETTRARMAWLASLLVASEAVPSHSKATGQPGTGFMDSRSQTLVAIRSFGTLPPTTVPSGSRSSSAHARMRSIRISPGTTSRTVSGEDCFRTMQDSIRNTFERNVALDNLWTGFRAEAGPNLFSNNRACKNSEADALDLGSD